MLNVYSGCCGRYFTIAMIPQVQVAATNIASYFANEVSKDEVVNEGIRDENNNKVEGMSNGKFMPLDEKITDQGLLYILKNYMWRMHVYLFIIELKSRWNSNAI